MKVFVLLLALTWLAAPAVGQPRPPSPPGPSLTALSEKIRQDCIDNRRMICGRILKILPEGLIVESGYPSLRRAALRGSWLIPSTTVAERDAHLVEGREPDALCVGTVLLTNTPKSRRNKPKLFDYVVIEGFPAGNFTYHTIGGVQHTVRRFSAILEKAVEIDRAAAVSRR